MNFKEQKVAIVTLPSSFLIDDKVFPSLGILYMASALRRYGLEPKHYDLSGKQKFNFGDIKENVIFVTITTAQIQIANKFVGSLLEFDSTKRIVVGGCGAEGVEMPSELYHVIVRGEAENLIPEIFKAANRKGQTYLRSSNIVNIDENVLPARDLLSGYKYLIDGKDATTMITSRGCPFGCIFCVDGNKKQLRIANSGKVCLEIDQISSLGWRGIMFFDDIFTLKLDRLRDIGNHILNKGMVYRCFTHVNFVNEKLSKILTSTNCKEVGIGIESGNNEILKTIKKGFTAEKSLRAIEILKSHGLRVKTFLMIGLPGESEKSIADTRKWLDIAKPNDFDITLYQPFPNTHIWNNRNELDISWDSSLKGVYKGKVNEYNTSVKTSNLSEEQLLRHRNQIEKDFK